MSTANEQSLWRRMRFTPVSDALRGRLTGSLDPHRLIGDADLPVEIAASIHRVVRHSRLWRGEKFDIATELIAHFRDGLEDGVSAEELVTSFGDERQTARLIRRAKKRNRPWPWHVARAMSLAVCAMVGMYTVAALLLLMSKPDVSVDYLARLNAPAMAVPEEDRAWPLYREALLAGFRDLELTSIYLDMGDTRRRGRNIRVGEPGWPKAAAFVRDQRELLAMIREAADKPGLGLVVGHSWEYTDLDHKALYGPDHQPAPHPSEEVQGASSLAHLAAESLSGVLLPQLTGFRNMARLLVADTELAYDEGDHERIFANLNAILGLARHSRETPVLINSLVAMSIAHLASYTAADMFHRDSERWSREELAQLAHLLAGIDPLVQPIYEGERLIMYDLFQRIYSKRGYVTHDGLLYFQGHHLRPSDHDATKPYINTVSTVYLPLANLLMASRSEMEHQFDHLMATLEAETAMPLWERLNHSPTEAAAQDLIDDFLGGVRYAPLALMVPAFTAQAGTTDRIIAVRDALLVAIAMELYRRDHDTYPDDLADLSPRYLPQPPVDYSTGGPLRVRYTDDGEFILYGLGYNGEDNGGTLSEDWRRNWPAMPRTGDWVLYPPVIRTATPPDDSER